MSPRRWERLAWPSHRIGRPDAGGVRAAEWSGRGGPRTLRSSPRLRPPGPLAAMGIIVLSLTHALRTEEGFPKTQHTTAETFWAHCVDSWALAASSVRSRWPDTTAILQVAPVRLPRRHLHRREPAPGGVRLPYGSTRSLGLTRGALVLHPSYGLAYLGGTRGARISLHSLEVWKMLDTSGTMRGPTSVVCWHGTHGGRASSPD